MRREITHSGCQGKHSAFPDTHYIYVYSEIFTFQLFYMELFAGYSK